MLIRLGFIDSFFFLNDPRCISTSKETFVPLKRFHPPDFQARVSILGTINPTLLLELVLHLEMVSAIDLAKRALVILLKSPALGDLCYLHLFNPGGGTSSDPCVFVAQRRSQTTHQCSKSSLNVWICVFESFA